MKQRILAFLMLLSLIAMLSAPFFMTGCASPEQLQQAAADINQTIDEFKAELATLPPDDKGRAVVEEQLAKFEKYKATLEAAGDGEWEKAVALAIPGYGGLIAIGVKLLRRNRQVKQIINSVEAAFPAKTDAQKETMRAVQVDPDTRALVDKVKGS